MPTVPTARNRQVILMEDAGNDTEVVNSHPPQNFHIDQDTVDVAPFVILPARASPSRAFFSRAVKLQLLSPIETMQPFKPINPRSDESLNDAVREKLGIFRPGIYLYFECIRDKRSSVPHMTVESEDLGGDHFGRR